MLFDAILRVVVNAVPRREAVKLTWGCLFVLTLGLLPFNTVDAQGCPGVSFFTPPEGGVGWTISAENCGGIANYQTICTNCTPSVNSGPLDCSAAKTLTATGSVLKTREGPSNLMVTGLGCNSLTFRSDPVFTTLELTTSRRVRQIFTNIPNQEHYITISNGAPGLEKLNIRINRRLYTSIPLAQNETKNFDVSSAMEPGNNNTVTLTGVGELGASADVSILDSAPASTAEAGRRSPARPVNAGGNHLDNGVWGPLAEEVEETSDLHLADVSTQTVQIVFKGAMDKSAAGGRANYAVEVNGTKEPVVATNAKQSGAEGVNVTLQLPPGTLQAGDKVDVQWVELTDTKGRPLSGHVSLIAQPPD